MQNILSVPRQAWWCTTLIAALCVVGLSTPAAAQVDCNSADLQDLIDYVAQIGPGGCGLDIADAAQDITVNDPNFDPCDPGFTPGVSTYFENGFDQVRTLVAFADGNLYLGIRVAGTIGDADGNGDPDNNLCTDSVNIADEPGIGLSESYSWYIDNDCDGITEIVITVGNNAVQVSGLSPSATSFEYSGSDLKVCLTNVDLDPFFRARSFVGHLFDGLGEDLSALVACPPPTINIDVEKTVGDVCAGQNTTVNVTITNTGDAALDPVEIEDTLPAGFTYVGGSSSIGEPGVAGQVLSWSEGPLAAGDDITFSFMITAPQECFGIQENVIDVAGTFSHPCVNDGQPILALDTDAYEFECLPGPCLVLLDTDGPDAACPGEPIQLSATVENCSEGPADITVSIGEGEETFPNVPAGESVTFVYDTVMPAQCLANSNVCFDVEYSATNECGTTIGEPAEICVLCTRPEVSITKGSNVPVDECVINDDIVTYTITVENTGPVPVTDIVVTDEISGYGYFVGGSDSPAADSAPADGGQGTLQWNLAGPAGARRHSGVQLRSEADGAGVRRGVRVRELRHGVGILRGRPGGG